MVGKKAFTLTLSNNKTEKQGIAYLRDNYTGFYRIDLDTKKRLLDLLEIDRRYLQSFDMIYISDSKGVEISKDIIHTYIEDIIFVELKTTKKYLPDNPKGFFFGATENEFNFGELLGDKFRFCFVSLHEKGSSYAMLTLEELNAIIRTKRIQYQINL